MGKFIIGLCFLLIGIFLYNDLTNETLPEVEEVGEDITADLEDLYEEPGN